jgi:hypothetical protein
LGKLRALADKQIGSLSSLKAQPACLGQLSFPSSEAGAISELLAEGEWQVVPRMKKLGQDLREAWFYLLFNRYLYFFIYRALLCSLSWPQTHDPSAFASQLLGL